MTDHLQEFANMTSEQRQQAWLELQISDIEALLLADNGMRAGDYCWFDAFCHETEEHHECQRSTGRQFAQTLHQKGWRADRLQIALSDQQIRYRQVLRCPECSKEKPEREEDFSRQYQSDSGGTFQ